MPASCPFAQKTSWFEFSLLNHLPSPLLAPPLLVASPVRCRSNALVWLFIMPRTIDPSVIFCCGTCVWLCPPKPMLWWVSLPAPPPARTLWFWLICRCTDSNAAVFGLLGNSTRSPSTDAKCAPDAALESAAELHRPPCDVFALLRAQLLRLSPPAPDFWFITSEAIVPVRGSVSDTLEVAEPRWSYPLAAELA